MDPVSIIRANLDARIAAHRARVASGALQPLLFPGVAPRALPVPYACAPLDRALPPCGTRAPPAPAAVARMLLGGAPRASMAPYGRGPPARAPPPYGTRAPPAPAAVARLALAAGARVSFHRNPVAAMDEAGLRSAFSELGGVERAGVVGAARLTHDTEAAKPLMYRNQYSRFSLALFPYQPELPVTFVPLRAFLGSYVLERGNKSSGLSGVLSHLARICKAAGQWSVSDTDLGTIKEDIKWLKRMYPSPAVPTRELSTDERLRFYAACADGTLEGALAHALLSTCVAAQMRFTEAIGLHEEDVRLGEHGLLIQVVRDKTHQSTLAPYPRACARYPPWFAAHDAMPPLQRYLTRYAGGPLSERPVRKGYFFFTQPERVDGGAARAGNRPLTPEFARALLIRYLNTAGVVNPDGLLNFSLHFARTTGFNDLANRLYLGRRVAAEAGGWAEGGCITQSYQKRTAADISSSLFISLLRVCRDLKREGPPGSAK